MCQCTRNFNKFVSLYRCTSLPIRMGVSDLYICGFSTVNFISRMLICSHAILCAARTFNPHHRRKSCPQRTLLYHQTPFCTNIERTDTNNVRQRYILYTHTADIWMHIQCAFRWRDIGPNAKRTRVNIASTRPDV